MSNFRTQADENYEAVRAEIGFITDLQLEIEAAMDRSGYTQTDLAKLLGVSEARVSQIMAENGANLEARTVAKIAHAFGLKPQVTFVDPGAAPATRACTSMSEWARANGETASWARAAVACNDDVWSAGGIKVAAG